jgi:8-oxo-dGTP pyrophosphatase MutT (NUDIX family)
MMFVKKRYTYNYVAFVFGQYGKNDNKRLKCLFNGMTRQEKIDINSLRFDYMWYKIWLEFPEIEYAPIDFNSNAYSISKSMTTIKEKSENNFMYCKSGVISKLDFYLKKKKIFDTCFTLDGGARLKHLLTGTKNINLSWEIPKGRGKKNETDMDSAVREFEEETNMGVDLYNIMFGATPVSDSHMSMNITYIHKYFMGYASKKTHIPQKFDFNSQLNEIGDIKWMALDHIKFIDQTGELTKLVSKIFNIFNSMYTKPNI